MKIVSSGNTPVSVLIVYMHIFIYLIYVLFMYAFGRVYKNIGKLETIRKIIIYLGNFFSVYFTFILLN